MNGRVPPWPWEWLASIQMVPMIGLTLPAGHVADTWNRKHIILCHDPPERSGQPGSYSDFGFPVECRLDLGLPFFCGCGAHVHVAFEFGFLAAACASGTVRQSGHLEYR